MHVLYSRAQCLQGIATREGGILIEYSRDYVQSYAAIWKIRYLYSFIYIYLLEHFI